MLGLRLRSWFGRVDWYAEAYMAAQAGDWATFVGCMNSDIVDRLWWVALRSGSWSVVEAAIRHGADVDARQPAHGFELSTDESMRLQKRTSVPLYPGWDMPPLSGVSLVWLLGFRDVYRGLVTRVSPATRFDALLWALLCNDTAWIATFAEADYAHAPTRFTPATAALFGGVSAETFARVWAAMPAASRAFVQTVTTSPPGHEEGGHPFYEGDALYWAQRLGRDDVVQFLR